MGKRFNLIIYLTILMFCFNTVLGQRDSVLYRNLVNQSKAYIHEKVYTMTDRGYYYAGDTVWLRSFIVDAATNLPLNSSIYNYIDLIDWRTRKTVRSVVVRRSDNDIYKGYIALDDTLMSGKYLLNSYTKYQLSDNRTNLFTRIINVYGVDASQYDEKKLYNRLHDDVETERRKTAEKNNPEEYKRLKDKRDINVRFYPEGGGMVIGTLSQIAFEACDKKEKPLYVDGKLYDSNNNFILEFKSLHRGMGVFSFVPQNENGYYCILKTRGNDSVKVSLPGIVKSGVALSAIPFRNNIKVRISATDDVDLNDYRIVAIERGVPLWIKNIDKREFLLDKSDFKEGIVSLALVSLEGEIKSIRKCFIENKGEDIAVEGGKSSYGKRERVELMLKNIDLRNTSCAVSITNGAFDQTDNVQTARSWLLLSSEIKDYLTNPNVYFSDDEIGRYADLVMMVKGWTSYNIDGALKGEIERPTSSFETGIDIKGEALSLVRRKPVKDAAIRLTIPDYSFIKETRSDENGNYAFENLEIPDSTTIWISGLTKSGKENLLLKINLDGKKNVEPHTLFDALNVYTDDWETRNIKGLDFAKVIENSTLRNYNLPEVDVLANRIEKPKVPVISKFSTLMPNSLLERKRTQRLKDVLTSSSSGFFINTPVVINGEIGEKNNRQITEEFTHLRMRFRYRAQFCRLYIDGMMQPEFMEEFWYNNLRGDGIEQVEIMDAISANSFNSTEGTFPIVYVTLRKGDVERDILAPNFAYKLISSFQKPVD
ncbi:MAG: hypothetical protein Q4F97_08095, partial [Bacteroidales bacterium]|nr:hypothetical protein [Bacteroidales bacterium]